MGEGPQAQLQYAVDWQNISKISTTQKIMDSGHNSIWPGENPNRNP
jgi:hypothetical protein